jgi:ABC-2 type transport system permease protein
VAQHNLNTVVGFEFFRTVKRRRFWITTLAIPVLLAIVFALVFVSSSSSNSAENAQKNAHLSFVYTDASGVITDTVAAQFGGTRATDPAKAIADVKAGTIDAYFAFPARPTTQLVQVYGVDKGIFKNGTYEAVAKQMLITSAQDTIGSTQLTALVQGDVKIQSQTYKNGRASGGINALIPPLLFLVAFYMTIILLANQMISSTLEEKENRVTEMILTTLNPTTLIVGKVLALFMVGAVQLLTFAAPIVVAYLFFRSNLNLPDVDLAHLSLQPGPMIVGALLLLGGFILFTGTLVAVGAVVPTAKEAGTYFGPMIALMFIPFYIVSLIISEPHAVIVQIFTYFPYSAPVTAMLRNGFGSLGAGQATIIITELFVLGFLALRLAVHLFRYGSISYSQKLSIRGSFQRKSSVR